MLTIIEVPEAMTNGANDEDLPAVFWDEMPSNNENADLAAINALIDEQTPAERAESHKVRKTACLGGVEPEDNDLNNPTVCRIKATKLLRLA